MTSTHIVTTPMTTTATTHFTEDTTTATTHSTEDTTTTTNNVDDARGTTEMMPPLEENVTNPSRSVGSMGKKQQNTHISDARHLYTLDGEITVQVRLGEKKAWTDLYVLILFFFISFFISSIPPVQHAYTHTETIKKFTPIFYTEPQNKKKNFGQTSNTRRLIRNIRRLITRSKERTRHVKSARHPESPDTRIHHPLIEPHARRRRRRDTMDQIPIMTKLRSYCDRMPKRR